MRQNVFNENSEESFGWRRCQFDLEKFDLDNFMNSTIKEYLGGCFKFERNKKIFEKIIDNGY